MADETRDNIWPLPKFYFKVNFGDDDSATFQEISGLDTESQAIEYRHKSSQPYPIKTPGIGKMGNLTIKKGILSRHSKFWDWYNEIKRNTIQRRTVVINLLDDNGSPKMTWTLNNAWPTKVTGTDLKSERNEVAVETIELAFETLTVRG